MGQPTKKAETTPEVANSAELIAQIEDLQQQLAAAKEATASSEAALTEALDTIDRLENRVKTGEVIVEYNGANYRVLPGKLGTLGLKNSIGEKTVNAEDLHKHPELIAEYLNMKSGFIQLIEN